MLDPTVFWRVHRSYVVNLLRIKDVIPWFNQTIQLKMADRGKTEDVRKNRLVQKLST